MARPSAAPINPVSVPTRERFMSTIYMPRCWRCWDLIMNDRPVILKVAIVDSLTYVVLRRDILALPALFNYHRQPRVAWYRSPTMTELSLVDIP